jgi:hypothetical protein
MDTCYLQQSVRLVYIGAPSGTARLPSSNKHTLGAPLQRIAEEVGEEGDLSLDQVRSNQARGLDQCLI